MYLHLSNWVLDDARPKKAGRYFTVSDGLISITSYSKKTQWGGVEVEGWCNIDITRPFESLGQQLIEEYRRRWEECDTIIIVGDGGEPLKVA